MDVEILSVVLATLLGAVISFVSFSYKSRVEINARVNVAIFQLLEVWFLLGVMKALNSKEFSSMFAARIKVKFPNENIDENFEKVIAESIEKAIPFFLSSQLGGEDYLIKYSEAVTDLAPIYPLLAYRLNKNQMLIKYLNGIDSLMAGVEATETDGLMMKSIKTFVNQDAFQEFERDLKGLSKKVGFFKSKELCRFVDGVKHKVDKIPEDAFDSYIDSVFSPFVQAHYDEQGIKNPNIKETV